MDTANPGASSAHIEVVDPLLMIAGGGAAPASAFEEFVAVFVVFRAALGVVPDDEPVGVFGVVELAVSFSGWRKATVSEPVLPFCSTWTSATKPDGRPHGSSPPGPAVPAIWVTLPRNI